MRPNKDRRTEIILYGLLLIPLLFAAAALAQATEQAQGLAEITAVLSEILHTPSMQMMTRLRRFADVGSRISTCFLSIGVHAEHFTQQNKRKAAFSMICPLI